MLARANRVTTGADFRAIVRRGRRTTTTLAVYYTLVLDETEPARFGFIVSRAVGTAVRRNRVRRRLRAVCRELVDGGARGHAVVVRALPSSAEASWGQLRDDVRGRIGARLVSA